MADKQAKNAKRKKKFRSKAEDDLSLEDVLAVGGDKVSIICSISALGCITYRTYGGIWTEFYRVQYNLLGLEAVLKLIYNLKSI